MRIRMTLISQILPALLVLAMTAGTQAQTNSQDRILTGGQSQSDLYPTSRYRFVPTKKREVAPLPSPQFNQRSQHLDRFSQARAAQQTTRVAALIPARDLPTSPSTLNPTVDASAFHSAGFETVVAVDNHESRGNIYVNPAATGNIFTKSDYVQASAPQPEPPAYQPQQFIQAPAPAMIEQAYVPMNRNFFGVNSCECCDEWDGFIACGGLKANPGHYGQPFIVGCDPCEPPCGRCSKCLIEKHRAKHSKSHGCKKCDGRSNGCSSCGNESQQFETKNSDCDCDACTSTAKKGGFLGYLLK